MRWFLALFVLLVLFGCDEATEMDAGSMADAAPAVDAGPPPDAGPMPDGGSTPDAGPSADCASAPANFGIGSGWTLLDSIDPRAVGIPTYGEGSTAQIVVRGCVVDLFQGDNGSDTWTMLSYTNEADGFELVLAPGIGPDHLEEITRLEIVGDHYFAIGTEGSAPYMATMPIGGTEFREVVFDDGSEPTITGWAAFGDTVYVARSRNAGTVRSTMGDVTSGQVALANAADLGAYALRRFGDGMHTIGLGTSPGAVVDRGCLDGVIDGGGGATAACETDEPLGGRTFATTDIIVRSETLGYIIRRPGGAGQMIDTPTASPGFGPDLIATDGADSLVIAFQTAESATVAHVTNLDGVATVTELPDMTTRLQDPELIDVWTNGTHVLALVLAASPGRRLALYGSPL